MTTFDNEPHGNVCVETPIELVRGAVTMLFLHNDLTKTGIFSLNDLHYMLHLQG